MSIGKSLALGLLLAGSAGCTADDAPPPATAVQSAPAAPSSGPAAAWWVTRSFPADGAAVRGVAVASIDPSWRAANELDDARLRATLSSDEYAAIAAGGFSQSLTDGANTLVVGTYRTDAGGGRFLLGIAGGKVIARLTDPGEAGFSTLKRQGNAIHWYKCMECDDYDVIVRSGSGYAAE